MCGTCDSDASNDCTQDCAGTWGGDATFQTYWYDSDGDGLGDPVVDNDNECMLNSDCNAGSHCNSEGECEVYANTGQCSDSNICDAGEGDCDSDTNCSGNLMCLQSETWDSPSGMDYCYCPDELGYDCSGVCGGDDSSCAEGCDLSETYEKLACLTNK